MFFISLSILDGIFSDDDAKLSNLRIDSLDKLIRCIDGLGLILLLWGFCLQKNLCIFLFHLNQISNCSHSLVDTIDVSIVLLLGSETWILALPDQLQITILRSTRLLFLTK